AIQVRCSIRAAVTADVAVAEVVGKNQNNVWFAGINRRGDLSDEAGQQPCNNNEFQHLADTSTTKYHPLIMCSTPFFHKTRNRNRNRDPNLVRFRRVIPRL